MSTKTQRKHLEDYTDAAREIELSGAAVSVLEGMRSAEAQRAIKLMHTVQQRRLKHLDAAAEKLGAPYPTKEQT